MPAAITRTTRSRAQQRRNTNPAQRVWKPLLGPPRTNGKSLNSRRSRAWMWRISCRRIRVEGGRRVAEGVDGIDKPVVRLRDSDQYVRIAKGQPAPDTIYTIGGKYYETDNLGRPVSTSGRLTVGGPSHRIPATDRAIGHAGLPGDVGFHHGGDQFGFGGGKLNLSPGSGELNSGQYKGLEMYLRRQAAAGHDIDGRFSAYYAGKNETERPNRYVIQFAVDGGAVQERAFFNPRPKG